jgi:hypothetical protein
MLLIPHPVKSGPINIHYTRYLTPRKSGCLRVTAELGLRITLKSESGDTFYFDALSEQFIDSLDQFVPTPTSTPIPLPPYPYP